MSSESSTSQRIAQGLAKIALTMRQEAWRETLPRGLTPTQAQVLTVLAARRSSDAPPRLSDMADALAVTPATASDAVRVLVEKGLVAKTRRGRAIELSLTRQGNGVARKLADWPDFLLETIGDLNEAERAVFLRSLVKMIRSLQERGRIPVQRMCVECRYFQPYAHRDETQPHHCQFVNAPFGDTDLRLDCPDQEPVAADVRPQVWELFVHGNPVGDRGKAS